MSVHTEAYCHGSFHGVFMLARKLRFLVLNWDNLKNGWADLSAAFWMATLGTIC